MLGSHSDFTDEKSITEHFLMEKGHVICLRVHDMKPKI